MSNKVHRLSEEEVFGVTWDARVAAIRWDVLPWELVLDLDSPLSEGEGVPLRRVWLAFGGVSEITLELRETRIPNGLWISTGIDVSQVQAGFEDYGFLATLPTFAPDDTLVGRASRRVVIRATSLVGAASVGSTLAGALGVLEWAQRVALASDEELVQALAPGPPGT